MDAIRGAGIELPPEYAWFGRSFDGLDRRFLGPIQQHAARDYARILEWFPLAARPSCAARPLLWPGRALAAEDSASEPRGKPNDSGWPPTPSTGSGWCFRHEDGPRTFAAAVGLQLDDGYVAGQQLGEVTAAWADRKTALSAMPSDASGPVPDPLAGVPSTGDLAADAAAELASLLAALTAPAEAPANVLDSPHHLIAWWPTRAAKNAWLASTGLVYGPSAMVPRRRCCRGRPRPHSAVPPGRLAKPSGRAPAPVSPARPPQEDGKDQQCLTSPRRHSTASASRRG